MFSRLQFNAQFNTDDHIQVKVPSGALHTDICLANVGELIGSARTIKAIVCDGVQDSDSWSLFNINDKNGHFLEHIAIAGAVSENQAIDFVSRYCPDSLFDGVVHSEQKLSHVGMQRFLDCPKLSTGTPYVLESDAEHFNQRIIADSVVWEEDRLISHSCNVSKMLLDMVQHDDHEQLIDLPSKSEIINQIMGNDSELCVFDAIVIQVKELDRVIAQIGKQLTSQGDKTFNLVSVTKIQPFKRLGVVNVGAIFEMSDTQLVTVLFNNPDTTPSKLSPTDVLTSWKWILNRRDVTAALQPKATDSRKYSLIARRMMQLLVKNHPRFVRAQAEKLRIQAEFEQSEKDIETASSKLNELDAGILAVQQKIDTFAADKQKQVESNLQANNSESNLTEEGADSFHANLKSALEQSTNSDTDARANKDTPVTLTGNEFGEFEDTPEGRKQLRHAVKEKLTALIGQWFDCPALNGQVEVRRSGVKKTLSLSGDPRKLMAIHAIKELLHTAKFLSKSEPSDPSIEPNIKAYHYLQAPLVLKEKNIMVRFVVREDDKGKYHYDLNVQKDILKNAESPLLDGLSTATFPAPGVSQEELDQLAQFGGCHLDALSIELDQENVNILDSAAEDSEFVLNMLIVEEEQAANPDTDTTVTTQSTENEQQPTDDLSDVTTDENYRWKDTAVIAGARKYLSASFAQAKKEGRNIISSDVDWDELQKDPRLSQTLIKKANVFGVVDWNGLRDDGMPSNIAYFIKKMYTAIAQTPILPLSLESSKDYVTAISNLRERMEKIRTYDELRDAVVSISKELIHPTYLERYYQDHSYSNVRKDLQSYDARVMSSLGKSFYSWIFKSGNSALYECRNGKKYSNFEPSKGLNWEWLDGEPKVEDAEGKTVKPKKTNFQLEVATTIERVGGSEINIQSSKELEETFGFRGIQSGNWVLKDRSSAEFHMKAAAEAMLDMSDVLGIEPQYLGLKGNLALAFGARGKGGALAHYEPGNKIINIIKMKGGGSLGHEYFHALDNLIQDLSTQTVGDMGFFGTRDYSKITDPDLAEKFKKLTKTLLVRDGLLSYKDVRINPYNDKLDDSLQEWIDDAVKTMARNLNMSSEELNETPLDKLAQKFSSWVTQKQRDSRLNIATMVTRMMGQYLIARHYTKADVELLTDGTVQLEVPGFESPSLFYRNALKLDGGKADKYWSKELELAARSFSAYLQDRLAAQGRKNDYLAYSTQGGKGRVGEIAYPQGAEREAVNQAFDELFTIIREKKILEQASSNQALMDSLFGNIREDYDNPVEQSRYVPDQEDLAQIYDMSNDPEDTANGLRLLKELFTQAGWTQSENNEAGIIVYSKFTDGDQEVIKFGIDTQHLWVVDIFTIKPNDVVEYPDESTFLTVQPDDVIELKTWNGIDINWVVKWINEHIEKDENKLKAYPGEEPTYFTKDDAYTAAKRAGFVSFNQLDSAVANSPYTSTFNLERLMKRRDPDGIELGVNDYLAQSAATSDLNTAANPTDQQLINNDYATGKIVINGLMIEIENPVGSTRSGMDPNGNEWSTTMTAHYGFIADTKGNDGDEIDVFIAPNTPQDYNGPIFVIAQNDSSGNFDEHKIIIGVQNKQDAIQLYRDHYDENWTGLASVHEYTFETLGAFLEEETIKNSTK